MGETPLGRSGWWSGSRNVSPPAASPTGSGTRRTSVGCGGRSSPTGRRLGMIHSAAIIDGIWDRLTQQARLLKTANTKAAKDTAAGLSPDPDGLGDPADARTLDQLRADVCADTLLTGAASGHDTTAGLLSAIQARVEVTVPVCTLMGPTCARTDAKRRREHAPRLVSAPSSPGSSPAGNPSTPTRRGSSPAAPPAGSECSPTPSPGRSSPSTGTGPTPTCAASCTPATPAADSPPAGCPPPPKTSTTRSTPRPAGRPRKATSAGSAADTISSNTTHPWRVRQLGARDPRIDSPTGATYIDRPPAPVTFTIHEPDPDPPPDAESASDAQPPPF